SSDLATQIAKLIARMGRHSLRKLESVPSKRAETLPYAGLLLSRILKRTRAQRVIFSSQGLRAGWVFSRLPESERAKDPLLVAARGWALSDSRFGDLGEGIAGGAAPHSGQGQGHERRIRLAVCTRADDGGRHD